MYRWIAHIIHLAAKHIVQVFSQDGPVMDSEFPVDAPADLDEDSETLYVSGDTLRMLWAFINQVCGPLLCTTWHTIRVVVVMALQTLTWFRSDFPCKLSHFSSNAVLKKVLPCLELIKYVQMCWSSMYNLLE